MCTGVKKYSLPICEKSGIGASLVQTLTRKGISSGVLLPLVINNLGHEGAIRVWLFVSKKRQKVLLRNSGKGTTLIPPHCPLQPVAETLGRLCLVQKGEKTKQNKKTQQHIWKLPHGRPLSTESNFNGQSVLVEKWNKINKQNKWEELRQQR